MSRAQSQKCDFIYFNIYVYTYMYAYICHIMYAHDLYVVQVDKSINTHTHTHTHTSSRVWAVHSFFASQTLHSRFFLKKSGDVNDEANFPFYFLLHKRAKPIHPSYLIPHLRARTQTPYSPLTFSLTSARELKPILSPYLLSLPTYTPIP